MGKREEQDARKALTHQEIKVKTRFSLIDLLLWPIRAYKQKKHEADIRSRLFKPLPPPPVADHVKNSWIYKTVTEETPVPEDAQIIKEDDWLRDIITEDDKDTKGE